MGASPVSIPLPDLTTAEWVDVVAAVFTAIAATAAMTATLLQLYVLGQSRRPHLSHVLRGHGVVGQPGHRGRNEIRIANSGPGVAIQTAFLLVRGEQKWGGPLGEGHLRAGDEESVFLGDDAFERDEVATMVYACRDLDNNVHIWSNHGRYKRIGRRRILKRDRTSLGDWFREMYPDVAVPSGKPREEPRWAPL